KPHRGEDKSRDGLERARQGDRGDDENEKEDEEQRRRRVSRNRKRRRTLSSPEDEERRRGQADEDERRAEKVRHDLGERARQHEHARRGREDRRRSSGSAASVRRGQRRRKQSVPADRDVETRRHEEERERADDDRNDDDGRESGRSAAPEHRVARAPGQVRRVPRRSEGHEVQKRRRGRGVGEGYDGDPERESTRESPFGRPPPAGDQAGLPESAEGEEHGDEAEPERLADRGRAGPPREEGNEVRDSPAAGEKRGDVDERDRRDLERGQSAEQAR